VDVDKFKNDRSNYCGRMAEIALNVRLSTLSMLKIGKSTD
jgi:hypothetical protein